MVIEKSIQVKLETALFWAALKSPELAKTGEGCYVCDWRANSEIRWVSNLKSGHFRGKVLQIQEHHYLSFIRYHPTVKHHVTSLFCYQIKSIGTKLQVRLRVELVKACDSTQHIFLDHWLNNHLQNIYALAVKMKSSLQLPIASHASKD